MKHILILLSILFLHYSGTNAQVAIVNEKENIAYLGVDNPFSFAVFDFPCMDIDVQVDNGVLIKAPKQCGKFIYKPAKAGTAKFSITGRKKDQLYLIDVVQYRVVNPPLPTSLSFITNPTDEPDPMTGECCYSLQIENGQHIALSDLKTPIGMSVSLVNFNYDIRYTITRFNYTISRNGQTIKKGTNLGARCSNTLIEDMKALQVNDVILFDAIYCDHNNKEHLLPKFEIVIDK